MWPNTVRKSDLRIDFYRGSGKGGSNRNKRDTACRIVHLPTGTISCAEDERTQGQNKRIAFKRLCDRLIPLMKKAATSEKSKLPTERIRTYHKGRQEVTDSRIAQKKFDYEDILNGDALEKIHEALRSSTYE